MVNTRAMSPTTKTMERILRIDLRGNRSRKILQGEIRLAKTAACNQDISSLQKLQQMIKRYSATGTTSGICSPTTGTSVSPIVPSSSGTLSSVVFSSEGTFSSVAGSGSPSSTGVASGSAAENVPSEENTTEE